MPALVNALNKVDFPTLGRPTIPHFKLMAVPENRARKCMPCDWRAAWRRLAGFLAGRLRELLALALCAFWLGSAAAAAPTALPLGDAYSAFDAQPIGQIWVD